MNAKRINALAHTITQSLFTDGNDRTASRLVMEFDDGHRVTTGGGWCQRAVLDVIRDAIIDAVIHDLKQPEEGTDEGQ